MRVFVALVGLAMFAGFGAAAWFAWVELRAFPSAPEALTVRAALARPPGPGAWVELTDVRLPCAQDVVFAGKDAYRLGFSGDDASGEPLRIIVAGQPACSDAPTHLVGVVRWSTPPRGVVFPGQRFEGEVAHLWLGEDRGDFEGLVVLMPALSLLGLVVVAGAFARREKRKPVLKAVEGTVEGTPWSADERVLPARVLRFAASPMGDRLLSVFALLVIGWVGVGLGWVAHLKAPGVGGWIGLCAFGSLGVLALLGVWRLLSALRTVVEFGTAERHEALVKVLETKRDRGSLHVTFAHPLTGAPMTRVVGARSSVMVVDGRVFVVWASDPKALILISEEFFPFELTPTEQREAARRVLRWRKALGP